MEKEFEAHYSNVGAWSFLCLLLLFPIVSSLLSIFWIPEFPVAAIVVAWLIPAGFVWMYRFSFRKKGLAVEVADQKLVLHKKTDVVIPLCEIVRVSIHEGGGSFDLSVKTPTAKYSLHCFVKEQRRKTKELIRLLRSRGISTDTYDLSGD
ncbi:MAG: hypothetical protein E7620_03310 [Ruminococcaceae bacterium]|nr:hypothetical protein [Oscillospiraceae bacterium]